MISWNMFLPPTNISTFEFPEPVNVILYGKMAFAVVIKVKNLEMESLFWISLVNLI